LQWAQLKQSPIAMDVINTIIVRRKVLMRQASQMQWGRLLQSASKPQDSLANKCDKGVMSIMNIIIPQQLLLLQERQLP
jgi:hypothetical protein